MCVYCTASDLFRLIICFTNLDEMTSLRIYSSECGSSLGHYSLRASLRLAFSDYDSLVPRSVRLDMVSMRAAGRNEYLREANCLILLRVTGKRVML